jgi:hypothetical protein
MGTGATCCPHRQDLRYSWLIKGRTWLNSILQVATRRRRPKGKPVSQRVGLAAVEAREASESRMRRFPAPRDDDYASSYTGSCVSQLKACLGARSSAGEHDADRLKLNDFRFAPD